MHYDTPSFLFLGYFVCLALYLPCFACFSFLFFSFLCFACFLGVSRFLVGIILILVKYFSFFAFRILYRITSYPYHIIYLASISSYVFLFLCLQECYASIYLPLSSVYFPVLLFISFFLVILLLSLRNKTGEKRYFL